METLKLSLDEGETLLGRLLRDGVDIAHDCGGVLACSSKTHFALKNSVGRIRL